MKAIVSEIHQEVQEIFQDLTGSDAVCIGDVEDWELTPLRTSKTSSALNSGVNLLRFAIRYSFQLRLLLSIDLPLRSGLKNRRQYKSDRLRTSGISGTCQPTSQKCPRKNQERLSRQG